MAGKEKIVIIAGPNGAGKTTFALEFLPNEADCPVFVNADLIAAGLAPFSPEAAAIRAGRLMLEEIKNHVRRRESFAFETTLSGLMYARLIPTWQALGYSVRLIYLSLPSPDLQLHVLVREWRRAVTRFLRQRFAAASKPGGATSIRNTSFSSMRGRCMIILNLSLF